MKPEFRFFVKVDKEGMGFICEPDFIDFIHNRIAYDDTWFEQDEFILMLFTGLFDRNGNKIYENDYLRNIRTKEIFKVVWNKNCAAFEIVSEQHERKSLFFVNRNFSTRYEVIGNAHENPEIVKII